MKWIYVIAVVGALLGTGCSSTTVTHRTAAREEILIFIETSRTSLSVHGGLIPGGRYVTARINLQGKKAKYTDGQFTVTFLADYFSTGPLAPQVSGSISMDWSKQKVVVDLVEWHDESHKFPSTLNGTYSFRESGPNDPPEPVPR